MLQFVLSFPSYALGTISTFFVLQGLISAGDALVEKTVGGKGSWLYNLPTPVKCVCVLSAFSPTVPLFSNIWVEQGMFDLMAKMVPSVTF